MELTLPMALQVALYIASGAVVATAVVLVRVALRLGREIDRAVIAMEHVEAEVIPVARGMRALLDRLHEISEKTSVAADTLLFPVRTLNRTIGLLQTGVGTFLKTFWNGPAATHFDNARSGAPDNGDPRS